ncbi:CULT domain-containing protein, partial [Meloidogyne graminicola]
MASIQSFTSSNHQRECLYKILVIGDMGTGKTSLIQRYIHDSFPTLYKPTIGVDFATKLIKYEDTLIRLQFWDISGQERFANMTRVYYRDSHGAFIALRWKKDLDSKLLLDNGQPIPAILLANKSDLENNLTTQQLMGQVKKGRFVAGFKISVKSGDGVDTALQSLLMNIVSNERHSLYLIPMFILFYFKFIIIYFFNLGCTTFADLLCRTCGHSVTTASALINVKSPAAEDSWNMTILGVNTFVQVFKNSVPEKRGPHKRKRYTEGWVEFKNKRCAKEVAQMLNGQLVGGRKRSAAYDSVWTMKYLH